MAESTPFQNLPNVHKQILGMDLQSRTHKTLSHLVPSHLILTFQCSRTTCRLSLHRYQKHSPRSPVALDQDPPRSGQCLCHAWGVCGFTVGLRSCFMSHSPTKWLAQMQVSSQPLGSWNSLALNFQCSCQINCQDFND